MTLFCFYGASSSRARRGYYIDAVPTSVIIFWNGLFTTEYSWDELNERLKFYIDRDQCLWTWQRDAIAAHAIRRVAPIVTNYHDTYDEFEEMSHAINTIRMSKSRSPRVYGFLWRGVVHQSATVRYNCGYALAGIVVNDCDVLQLWRLFRIDEDDRVRDLCKHELFTKSHLAERLE